MLRALITRSRVDDGGYVLQTSPQLLNATGSIATWTFNQELQIAVLRLNV